MTVHDTGYGWDAYKNPEDRRAAALRALADAVEWDHRRVSPSEYEDHISACLNEAKNAIEELEKEMNQ